MERQRILDELAEVRALIEELKALLASEDKVTDQIVEELEEIRGKYADARRTEIGPPVEDFTVEDLIPEEDMAVTISHRGYGKSAAEGREGEAGHGDPGRGLRHDSVHRLDALLRPVLHEPGTRALEEGARAPRGRTHRPGPAAREPAPAW